MTELLILSRRLQQQKLRHFALEIERMTCQRTANFFGEHVISISVDVASSNDTLYADTDHSTACWTREWRDSLS